MFHHLLTNCDDIFASCSVSPPAGEGALDARITYVSRSLAWRMGTEPAAALGRSLVEMCHPEDQGAFCAELARARAAPDGRVNFLHRCLGRDGVPEWCRAVGMFAADALYLVFRDVRPTKTAELALRAFTLAASAELREPCNTIAVVLPVLARRPCIAAGARKPPDMHGGAAGGALSGQHAPVMHAAELMDAMWASAQLIQGIIGNVITVPQLEAGELALQQSVFSPVALIASVLKICRLAAAQQELPACITLVSGSLHGLAPLPPLVEADCDRLAQICQNLVTNAVRSCSLHLLRLMCAAHSRNSLSQPRPQVKFSAGKPVEVWAGVALQEPGAPPQLVLSVSDRGIGMTTAEAAACFRAGAAAAPAAGGGTGLGLTIGKMFAELMGGHLLVDSTPGQGSTFMLRVPVRVLAPDDAAALEALEAAAAAAQASARRVNDAHAEQEETRSLAAAEAAAYVHAVAAAVAAAEAGERAAVAAAAGAAHAGSPRKLRVLVADDHPLALRLVTRLLQLHGFAVTPVADGAAALAALQAAFPACSAGGTPAAAPFDLALLDMDMPVLSGPAATSEFRAWEAAALPPGEPCLPIVALTANVAAEHAHMCAAAGMTIFLAKPLRAADMPLLRAHAASFSEARAVAAAAAAALPAAAVASQAAAAAAASAHAVLGLPSRLGQPQ